MNIDRVLQLLSEGKDINKIAEMSSVDPSTVSSMIITARQIVNEKNSSLARKKYIIKKRTSETVSENDEVTNLLKNSELSVIPVEDTLIFYIAIVKTDDVFSGGVNIQDKQNTFVGKMSFPLTEKKEDLAFFELLINVLKIGKYFNTKIMKVRSDEDYLMRLMKENIMIKDPSLKKLYNVIDSLKESFGECLFEVIDKVSNEKTRHIALTQGVPNNG